MGRGALGKRSADANVSHVSVTTHILPKRPRPSHPAPNLKPLQTSWNSLNAHIQSTLHTLRQPSLDQIIQTLSTTPPSSKLPAICINLPPCDRHTTFVSILTHIRQSNRNILHLCSAHHSSMTSVTSLFDQTLSKTKQLVVALEDADRFPEHTLRDIIYICSKNSHFSSARSSIALLLGLGSSVDNFHSALGIYETGLIAPTLINMPNAIQCFKAIVENVLTKRLGDVELCQQVYDMLETAVFAGEPSVSTLLRVLHQVYTLHYYHQPLAAFFSQPSCQKLLQNASESINLQTYISKADNIRLQDCLKLVRNLSSTQTYLEQHDEDISNKQLCHLIHTWHTTHNLIKSRRHLTQLVIHEILQVFKLSQLPQFTTNNHTDMNLQLFRIFLPTIDGKLPPTAYQLEALLHNRISKCNRQTLQTLTSTLQTTIEAHNIQNDEHLINLLLQLEDLASNLQQSTTEPQLPTSKTPRTKILAKGGAAALQRRKTFLAQLQTTERSNNTLTPHRTKLCTILSSLIKSTTSDIPLYELYNFCDTTQLSQLCNLGTSAQPRTSFFTAMRHPETLLSTIRNSKLPDTALAYRLLSEAGRMHNLYDWYNTFTSLRTATNMQDTNTPPLSQSELQVRFAKACSELELLGLFKYTNRKTDHALRLIFE